MIYGNKIFDMIKNQEKTLYDHVFMSIEDTESVDEAFHGNTKKLGEFIIKVNSDEGEIPHFHMINKHTGKEIVLILSLNRKKNYMST